MLPLQFSKGFSELNDSQVMPELLNEPGTFEKEDEASLSPVLFMVGHIKVFSEDFWTTDFLNEKESKN